MWCPKYRKELFVEEKRGRLNEPFYEIGECYDIEIDRCEVAEDHVHVLV